MKRMDSKITILYEDDDVVVINKPSGVIVHEDGRTKDKTVVDWFLSHVPEAKGVGESGFAQDGSPLERSGVVHRLDKDTSGVLILAKTQKAFIHLKQQFHDRLTQKEYRTFVYGSMKEKWGSVNRPIGRHSKDFRLRSAEKGARGRLRAAQTDWELIGQTDKFAYLKILPKTGRTHQIRAHLKSLSRPIVNDTLYATESLRSGENLGFDRLALHAYKLTITMPNGEEQTFIAPRPQDFEEAEVSLAMA